MNALITTTIKGAVKTKALSHISVNSPSLPLKSECHKGEHACCHCVKCHKVVDNTVWVAQVPNS